MNSVDGPKEVLRLSGLHANMAAPTQKLFGPRGKSGHTYFIETVAIAVCPSCIPGKVVLFSGGGCWVVETAYKFRVFLPF